MISRMLIIIPEFEWPYINTPYGIFSFHAITAYALTPIADHKQMAAISFLTPQKNKTVEEKKWYDINTTLLKITDKTIQYT